jgi:hypothetical protein
MAMRKSGSARGAFDDCLASATKAADDARHAFNASDREACVQAVDRAIAAVREGLNTYAKVTPKLLEELMGCSTRAQSYAVRVASTQPTSSSTSVSRGVSNPHLAGTGKARCTSCQAILFEGRCLDGHDQGPPAAKVAMEHVVMEPATMDGVEIASPVEEAVAMEPVMMEGVEVASPVEEAVAMEGVAIEAVEIASPVEEAVAMEGVTTEAVEIASPVEEAVEMEGVAIKAVEIASPVEGAVATEGVATTKRKTLKFGRFAQKLSDSRWRGLEKKFSEMALQKAQDEAQKDLSSLNLGSACSVGEQMMIWNHRASALAKVPLQRPATVNASASSSTTSSPLQQPAAANAIASSSATWSQLMLFCCCCCCCCCATWRYNVLLLLLLLLFLFLFYFEPCLRWTCTRMWRSTV